MSVNRSEEIRRFYDKNPGARPKECIAVLAARGIEVSPTLVSCVRAKLKESVPERDMAGDLELVRSFVDSSGLDPEVAVEILARFAGVVEGVGGLVRFREVLAEVGSLSVKLMGDDSSSVVPEPASDVSGFSYDDVNDEEDDD